MAIAHVQTPAGGLASEGGLAFGSNNGAGNLITVITRYSSGGQTVTVTDSRSNTYALAKSFVQTNDSNGTISIHYAYNIAAGANTVTVDITGTPTTRFIISEFSGVDTSADPLDKTAGAEGVGTALASGAVTPATDGQLLLVGGFDSNTITFSAGTDFTMLTTVGGDRLGAEYYIQPTAGSHDGAMTASGTGNWAAVLATFKAPGGGGGTNWGPLLGLQNNRLVVAS